MVTIILNKKQVCPKFRQNRTPAGRGLYTSGSNDCLVTLKPAANVYVLRET